MEANGLLSKENDMRTMKSWGRGFFASLLTLGVLTVFFAGRATAQSVQPMVKLATSKGDIVIALEPARAPVSVDNFLKYVKSGYYSGLIFHRVIDGFMIQGGGLDKNLQPKPDLMPPIKNEAANGLKNRIYTVAMARTSDPDSATAQFFINVKDNPFLDHVDDSGRGMGYAVFGKVVKGQDVVDAIRKTPTGSRGGFTDVPLEPVVIERAEVVSK